MTIEAHTIYVAEQGCYSDRHFAGVFDSVERAIAAFHKPGMNWTHTKREGKHGYEDWSNDKDWGEAVRIQKEEIEVNGPLYDGPIEQDHDHA